MASAQEPAPRAPTAAVAPTATVVRPEPGLARGVLPVPAWVVYAVAGAVVLASALYLARRLGLLRRLRA